MNDSQLLKPYALFCDYSLIIERDKLKGLSEQRISRR